MDTPKPCILVFDLDDTLYKEIDFLKSAYLEIACYLNEYTSNTVTELYEFLLNAYQSGLNAFETILKTYNIHQVSTMDLIKKYRQHQPNIQLSKTTQNVLYEIKTKVFRVGLITDGRSVQQRHKIEALGLTQYFNDIIISEEFGSEKPNPRNFLYFETAYGSMNHFIYVADNTKKAFIAPNALGWTTICLQDDGQNIHPQTTESTTHAPHMTISDLSELTTIIKKLI